MDGAIIRSGGTALDLRRLSAEELLLTLAKPVDGIVDLGNAQVSVLCDDPATWPADIRLDGFSYGSLITRAEQDRSGTDAMTYLSDSANTSAEILPARDRLVWLGRSSVGYRPQPYEQLAAFYRRMGHDDQARKVLLAKDCFIGYGYQPWLAAIWLVALVTMGSIVFAWRPPPPLDPATSQHFNSLVYTINLLLPVG